MLLTLENEVQLFNPQIFSSHFKLTCHRLVVHTQSNKETSRTKQNKTKHNSNNKRNNQTKHIANKQKQTMAEVKSSPRIPVALQEVFVASQSGQEVNADKAPKNGIGFRIFKRSNNNGSSPSNNRRSHKTSSSSSSATRHRVVAPKMSSLHKDRHNSGKSSTSTSGTSTSTRETAAEASRKAMKLKKKQQQQEQQKQKVRPQTRCVCVTSKLP